MSRLDVFRSSRESYRWWQAWDAAGALESDPDARRRLAAALIDTDDVGEASATAFVLEIARRRHAAAEGIDA